jgi:peptidoglycan/LPS O-acetylase OafA/YrhL
LARERIDSITGLRGIAALWVALYHGVVTLSIDPGVPSAVANIVACGWLAVDLFFILSGYIISYVHQVDFRRLSWGEYARFLKLRIARIYPAHVAVALVWLPIIVGATILRPTAISPGVAEQFNGKTLLYALTLLNGWGIPGSMGWNLPSWSVGSEWFAYLTFPLVAVAANQIRSARTFLAVAALTMGIALMLSFVLRGGATFMLPENWTLVRVQSEFLLGCCVFGVARFCVAGRAYDALCAGALIAIVWLTEIRAPGLTVAALIVCFAALVLGLVKSTWIGQWLLGSRLLVYLGEISYSLYLAHGLVINLLKPGFRYMVESLGLDSPLWSTFRLAIFLCAIVVAGHVVYTYVESPCRHFLRRLWRTDVRQPSANPV